MNTSTQEWAELIRAITLAISALGTVFGGIISVQIFKQRLELASLRMEVKSLRTENSELKVDITGLRAVITEYTTRLNTTLDDLGKRNIQLEHGVEALSSASERIEKLRAVITKDGDRATLDAGLLQDDKDKLDQQTK